MAGRVNKKFVIGLAAGLAGMFALVAGAALFLMKNSAGDLARAGEVELSAKRYEQAQVYFSKAVNKEQTNGTYLEKWRESLRNLAPENVVTYRDYMERWRSATRQLARVQKENTAVQMEYLELLRQMQATGEFSRTAQDFMITESTALIDLHQGTPSGPWEAIKRYRGMAKFEIVNFVTDARPELAKEAETDLLAALAANPADGESAIVLENLYMLQSQRAAVKSMTDEAQALEAKAQALVDNFTKTNPQNALVQMSSIRRELAARQREMAKARATQQVNLMDFARGLQKDMKPKLDAVMASIRSMDAAEISMPIISNMRGLEMFLDNTGKLPYTEETVNLALAKQPRDTMLLGVKADLLESKGDLVAASATLQEILDLPMAPTSLNGLRLFTMRNNARFLQALWAGRIAAATPEAQRASAIATAKGLREKLAAIEAPDSAPVQFVDAQIAFAEGNLGRAGQLLDKYNQATKKSNADALYLAASIAEQRDQKGLAKELLEDTIRIDRSNIPALLALAEMEFRLQNYERAAELFGNLQQLAPDNKQISERATLAMALSGRGGPGTVTDPVVAALVEVRTMSQLRQGDKDRTAEVIPFLKRKSEELKYDPRLVRPLIQSMAGSGQREEAIAVIDKAVAANPDNTELRDLQLALKTNDPVQAQLSMIESRESSDIDKALARYYVYRNSGKLTEANAEMAKASALAPTDKRVVEYQFLDALDAKDWAKAEQLAKVAGDADMDDVGGLTFRARLVASQGKTAEALDQINQAIAKGGSGPEVFRLKGRMETMMGQNANAVRSFEQAIALRPSDVAAINDLLSALSVAGRLEDALKIARDSEKYASGDPTFLSSWLGLESNVGNKAFAIERREGIAKLSPNDRANLVSLANLYIEERNWDKARPAIDRARTLADGLDVLTLEASWNWEQGKKEAARTLFTENTAKVPQDKRTTQPYLAHAQFLAMRGDSAGSLIVLEEARALQNPKVMEADKAIVEVLTKESRFDEAATVCRRIINSGGDAADMIYRKRLVECLTKVRNYKDAETELAELVKAGEPDLMTTLLLAEVKTGLGDTRAAKDLLDRAVARFPSESMVFLKRGQSMLGDPKTARDAISDFNKALQLSPGMWQAYRMRSMANIELNQVDEAIKDLRAAVRLSPFNDELLFGLLADLLRMGRADEATDIATEAIGKRNRDVNAIVTTGTVFASAQAHPQAARFFKMAFDLDKQDSIAQRYLDSLLSSTPPNTSEAQQALISLGESRVKTNPGFLMAVAKLSMKLNRPRDANAAASDALRLLKTDEPTLMLAWYNDLRRLLTKKEDLVRYLEETAKIAEARQSQEWLRYFIMVANLEDPATKPATIPLARELLKSAQDPAIRQLLSRATSSSLIVTKEYTESLKVMREALGEFPNDVELLNNMAYVLATQTSDVEAAIPLIEKAVSITPAVADIQDTYGVVFMAAKKCDKAAEGFRKALLLASNPQQTINYGTHLMEALLCSDRKQEARDLARDLLRTVETNSESLSEDSRAKFAEVKKKVDAA